MGISLNYHSDPVSIDAVNALGGLAEDLSIADSLDAATDFIGRPYGTGKSLEDLNYLIYAKYKVGIKGYEQV